jgi:hypothetical protein
MLRFQQNLESWGRLSPSWLWLVLLESTNDRFLGVDPLPPGHVPTRVWYATTCLLIRDALGGCLARWTGEGNLVVTLWTTMVQGGGGA